MAAGGVGHQRRNSGRPWHHGSQPAGANRRSFDHQQYRQRLSVRVPAPRWKASSTSPFGKGLPQRPNLLRRRRPVRVTGVAVEDQGVGLQFPVKLFASQSDCLVVIVRTGRFEIYGVSHAPLFCTHRPKRISAGRLAGTPLSPAAARKLGTASLVLLPFDAAAPWRLRESRRASS